jgi:hypothetical protein
MVRAFLVLLLLLLTPVVACASEETPRPRGLPIAEAPPSDPSPRASPGSPPPPPVDWRELVRNAPPRSETAPEAPLERETPRDLEQELSLALSGMSACLAGAAADAPPRTRIRVQARVMPDGAVGQVSVNAPGLPGEVSRCLERIASGARFEAPVPGAPRTVATSVVVERIATAIEPPPREEPPPASPGGAATDRSPGLPVQGPEGEKIVEAPGVEIAGPRGAMIDDAPGVAITGPQGVEISN